MTVNTPFASDRPATPYWNPRGVFASGKIGTTSTVSPANWGSGLPEDLGLGNASDVVGNITGDLTDVFRTIYSNQPGMYTAQLADGSLVTYRQPIGNQSNLPVGNIGGQLGANLQTNVGSGFGMWAIIGIGVFLFIMSRGKR